MPKNPGVFTEQGLASLKGSIAAICRHPYNGERSFVGFATNVGGGAFATISDGKIKLPWEQWKGAGPYHDLRIHLLDGTGRMYWVDWVYETPVLPIAVLQVRGDEIERWPNPEIATIAAMNGKNHVWRIGYADGVFGDSTLDLNTLGSEPPHVVKAGWISAHPTMTYFRDGADAAFGGKHTIAAHVCFDYPNRSDLGGPVVDNEGRLAGVLVGADLGSQETHVGAYVPAQMIMPFVGAGRAAKIYHQFHGALFSVLHQIDEQEAAASAA
ncbi:hypothetical protein [Microvirga calopogonii]|uniref:hypothetical protein n=1 Tax=Microvirga calopogonii TaxID=2078013 RepID=UPI000E0CE5BA|nr:hypothetical protein [Microvirga calopogonii]